MQSVEFTVAPEKVTRYLLDLSHETGGVKARFFLGYGFSPSRPDDLTEALLSHVRHPPRVLNVEDGVKYIFVGPMLAPNGKSPVVRSVWKWSGSDSVARFVTAYPG